MKFNNLEELVKYIITENVDIQSMEVGFTKSINTDIIEESSKELPLQATIECLSESPIINIEYGVDNILFVQSYESLTNACGAGKIKLFDREIMTNLCEMENETHISLPIKIGGEIKTIDFKLSMVDNGDNVIQLAKN